MVAAELLRTRKIISNETSRKLMHMAHGLVVASWPFFTSYYFIIAAEVLFLAVVLIARVFKFLQPLRNVNRQSWGEFYFPLAVILLAAFSLPELIFVAAMLHLALADALATLIGVRSKKGIYHIFGQKKSVAGSLAFYFTSLTILAWLFRYSPSSYPLPDWPLALPALAVVATLTENISPYGSDNLTVPLVVVGLLNVTTII